VFQRIASSIAASVFVCGIAISISGCSKPIDPKILELRSKFLITQELKSPITLTEAKVALADENHVSLVGKVGSGALDPFEKEKARFVLSEAPEDHGKDGSHDASECPFCRRRAEEAPLAQIEFQDPEGMTLPYGAETLFGMKKGQIVIVEGTGKYDQETDTLLIRGEKLFIKP
jgi:hypothetical protein